MQWSTIQQWEWKPTTLHLNMGESHQRNIEQNQPGTKQTNKLYFIHVNFKVKHNHCGVQSQSTGHLEGGN